MNSPIKGGTSTASPEPKTGALCAPTRWTLVVRACGETPEARTALAQLCEIYYQPILQFLLRDGRSADVAQELAQEFFARILSGSGFAGAQKEQGRFRSYVLGALKHFLSDTRDREHRLKRGSGLSPVSLDAPGDYDTSAGPALEAFSDPADINFDRQWALAVMLRATSALQQEFTASGKAEQFQLFKLSLVGDGSGFSLSHAASQLGASEATLRVAVHRFRKRFSELVRSEIGQTLRDPALVDEELRHLIEALSSQAPTAS
jgi:RNA polymerase sigma-70 factor (ECF subfamily)